MKPTQITSDKAIVELTYPEIAELLTLLGVACGRLQGEPVRAPHEDSSGLSELYEGFVSVLREGDADRERRGPPFHPGEEVVLDLSLTGPVPKLRDGEFATIIAVHDEDELHDYPWCNVRLADGREFDLPDGLLRRS